VGGCGVGGMSSSPLVVQKVQILYESCGELRSDFCNVVVDDFGPFLGPPVILVDLETELLHLGVLLRLQRVRFGGVKVEWL
jgi:hypothetical protein